MTASINTAGLNPLNRTANANVAFAIAAADHLAATSCTSALVIYDLNTLRLAVIAAADIADYPDALTFYTA